MKVAEMNDLFGIKDLEGVRGIDIREVIVDVCKRDIGDGHYNIDVLVYVRPDVKAEMVMPCVQKACVDIFGSNKPEDIETWFNNGRMADGKPLGIEVQGQAGQFQSFGISVKHPLSLFFSLGKIEDSFKKRLFKHLEAAA